MHIRQVIMMAGLAVAALGATAAIPAQAQGGCGPYAHRGWDGECYLGGRWGGPGRFYGRDDDGGRRFERDGYGGDGYREGWHRRWHDERPGGEDDRRDWDRGW